MQRTVASCMLDNNINELETAITSLGYSFNKLLKKIYGLKLSVV